jgi:hypothetical protein
MSTLRKNTTKKNNYDLFLFFNNVLAKDGEQKWKF